MCQDAAQVDTAYMIRPALQTHRPGSAHEANLQGNHVDDIVDGRLHHPNGKHCHDHGPVALA